MFSNENKFQPIRGSVPFALSHRISSPFSLYIPGNFTFMRINTVKLPTFSNGNTSSSSSASGGHHPLISQKCALFGSLVLGKHFPVCLPFRLYDPFTHVFFPFEHTSSFETPRHVPFACIVFTSLVATKTPSDEYCTKSFASYTLFSPVSVSFVAAVPFTLIAKTPSAGTDFWYPFSLYNKNPTM